MSRRRRRRRPHRRTWNETRQRIWHRDQGRCQGPYCTDHPPYSLPLDTAHIDHIIELSRGGSNADILCQGIAFTFLKD